MKKLLSLLVVALIVVGGLLLIKKKKEEIANLPTPKPPAIVVEKAHATMREVNQTKRVLGRYYALQEALIATKVPGSIEKLYVHEGSRVTKGTPLVKIDSSEIEAQIASQKSLISNLQLQIQAQEALLKAATIDEKNAFASLQRDRKLYRAGALAKEKLELKEAVYAAKRAKRISAQTALEAKRNELRAARKGLQAKERLLGYTLLTAPFDGVIARTFFKEGSFAPLGKPLISLIGAHFIVDAPFSGDVRAGMKAIALGKECVVSRILPQAQNGLHVARIECGELPIANQSQVEVAIVQKSAKGLALPIKALYEEHQKRYVLVQKDGAFHPIPITIVAMDEHYFIPNPTIQAPVAVGSNEKLAKLFMQKAHR